jgi:hypothetical protein
MRKNFQAELCGKIMNDKFELFASPSRGNKKANLISDKSARGRKIFVYVSFIRYTGVLIRMRVESAE